MRLKSLEIKGFKSFGDKVTIHFDEGVTSIVGPNGSGKSNVVDAMRWVLGEQKTRMLRSEKMENIIFNGTKTRKPANLAEVTLTFDNNKNILPTEYTTVSITRRLYRSGDSEYLLNGITCRLKDINDLFLDTGIGPDSYAIIELNMVDDILKDRNNSIKMLLEEAAGITKYKMRKKQTFQKLEETDADLNRVNDLLFEIEKSLKQLESQAKKTDRYYRLKEEYKTLSTTLAVFSIRSYKETLDRLTANENEQGSSRSTVATELEKLEAGLIEHKAESAEKERQLSTTQKLLNEKLMEITRSENEEKNRSERMRFLVEKQQQLTTQNANDEQQLIDVSQSIEQLNDEKQREEQRHVQMEEELNRLRVDSEESRKQYEASLLYIKELNATINQLRQSLNEFERRQAVRQTRYNSIQDEIQRLVQQREENEQKFASLETELNNLKPQREQADTDLKNLKQQRMEVDEQLRLIDGKLKEVNTALQAESRKMDARHNEYQLTKNLLEQMEGYPESIRYLKKNHAQFKSAPLVSEIIVCDDAYKVAIESYLDPYLNHFVVNTREEAWQALHLLQDAAKGRAQFFVLEMLENYEIKEPAFLPGCVQALDAVEKNAQYAKLFNMLLGHVYIMENEASLQDFNGAQDKSVVVLSQSGNFLKQKYVIAGGSVGMFDGKRTGKFKNLEKLAEEVKAHEVLIEEYKSQVKQTEQELAEAKQRMQTLQQDINKKESEFISFSGKVNTLESNCSFVRNTLNTSSGNTQKLEEESAAIQRITEEEKANPEVSPESLNLRLENQTQQLNVQQEHSQQLHKESSEKSQSFNQHNILFLQQQNRIQNIVRDLGYKHNQSNTLLRNKEQYAAELDQIKLQTEELLSTIETSSEEMKRVMTEREELDQLFQQHEKAYYKSKGDIDSEEKKLGELRRQKEHTDVLIQSVHEQLNDLKLQMNSLKERLSLEFNIELNDLLEMEPDPEVNEEELRPRLEVLRKKVGEFGPINPMALEQYTEIKERYDFIISEKTDLQNAKEALLKTIAEIDDNARNVFMDAYTAVRANFIRVFRSLFTEDDNCDLILSDPSSPLDSDITIIAQPKGKKPLSIHQLSGGEKTLTATALLFGIYLLKPAPFCIFDEVDAPLDDSNVDKFNNIIQKFSADSQFIIITHNKKTMAYTDIMYGITMAEPGVTSVVPVDLREYAE
ncbi:MAG: chromosome segregation protein SMC [Bacteroidota bacterium]